VQAALTQELLIGAAPRRGVGQSSFRLLARLSLLEG
jgi:hypothetical protein